jgi:tetratricopeptide (TPR) repeat protein
MNRWVENEVLLLRGRFYLHAKRWDLALSCYLRITELFPEHRMAHHRAGFCLERLGRYPEALTEYEKALQIEPDDGGVQANMSLTFEHLGNLQAAAEFLERALRNSSSLKKPAKAAPWRYRLGNVYLNLGDNQRAAKNFRLSAEADPKDYAYVNLAVALWRAGDKDASLETYRKAVKLFPNSSASQYGLGWALLNLDHNEEAAACLQTASVLKRDDPDAYYNLGLTLANLGKPEEALEAYRQAAKLRPDDPDTLYCIGLALEALKDFAGSIAAYREAVRLKPDHVSGWYNMGVMCSELGKADDEIEAYKRALQHDEKDVAAWGNLAITYSDKKMYQEALQAYRKVCELQPENELAFYLAGCSLVYMGRHAEALADFQGAVRIDPDWVSPHEWLGFSYAVLGRFLDAFACYKTAMRLASNSAQLHKELADFYEWRGQEPQAAQLRAKAAEFESQGVVDPLTMLPKRPIDKPSASPQP